MKHQHRRSAIVKIAASIILFLVFISIVWVVKADQYGTNLGNYNGVTVFSNGSPDYASYQNNYINGVYIGMKWQCVEYVRRYYYQSYGLDLASHHTGHAKTFWDAAGTMGLDRFPNSGSVAPQPGDMILSTSGTYGHIAIVRSVSGNQVRVAQQNFTENSSDVDYPLSLSISGGNYNVGGFNGNLPVRGWLRRQGAPPPDCTAGNSSSYQINGYQPVHANGALIKLANDQTFYLLREGEKRGITSQAVLEYLYDNGGFRFDDVITVSQAEFDSYSTGAIISETLPTNGETRPDGTIIRRPNGEISIVSENGGRRPFSNYQFFQNMGYKDCNIVDVSDLEYLSYQQLDNADAMPKLTASLRLFNIGNVGQQIRGEFTIRNIGTSSFTFSKLGIGGRYQETVVADFPFRTNVTLGPGEQTSYVDFFTPSQAGTYRFFVAYQVSNGVWIPSVPRHNGAINTETISIGSGTPTPTVTPSPTSTPVNNQFANATLMSGNVVQLFGTNINATKESGEPNHAGNAGGASVWYRWTPNASGTVTIDTIGSNFDTLLAAYTGSSVSGLTLIAANDDIGSGNLQSRIQFSALAGTTYRLAVDGFNNGSGSIATGSIVISLGHTPSSTPTPTVTPTNTPTNTPTATPTATPTSCSYVLSTNNDTVGPGNGGGSYLMNASSGCSWTAVSDSPSWLTTSSTGTGNGTISYNFTANPTTSSRIGHITAGGQVFTLTQIGIGGAGSVQFSSASYSIGEGAGAATITVTRSGGVLSQSGNVNYSTSNGTATAGNDYTSTSGTLFFFPNETSKTFQVTILEDGVIEGNETINLTLSNPSLSFSLGSPSTAVLTIVDNDVSTPTPTVTPTNTPTVTPTATATGTPVPSCTPTGQNFDVSPPAGWVVTNNSSPGPGTASWFQGNPAVFPALDGATNSYVGVNYNSGTTTSTLSNWLIMPSQLIKNGDTVTFFTRTSSASPYPDRLQVRMSLSGASVDVGSTPFATGVFNNLLLDINSMYIVGGYPETWTQYSITVSGVPVPTQGRLAFRYFVENGGPDGANSNYIGIDSLVYNCGAGQTPTPTVTPTNTPTATPTDTPTVTPTNTPTVTPTATPTNTPTATPTVTPTPPPGGRTIRMAPASGTQGGQVLVSVELTSLGNEAATQFSVNFDPSRLSISNLSTPNINPDVMLGSGAPPGTSLTVNANQALSGRIGILIDSNTPFASSPPARQMLIFRFTVASNATAGIVPLTFGDNPVTRSTSDAFGNPLSSNYENGSITISGGNNAPIDYDGDGRTDISIWRPSNGGWYLDRSAAGFIGISFGLSTDKIAPADYDGDGKTDPALFRPSEGGWYFLKSTTNTYSGLVFGAPGDIPAPGDFDGDGLADVAIFRPSTGHFWLAQTTAGVTVVPFGINGDVPVIGDYDGDGRSDVAIYRPSNGQWWINRSTGGVTAVTFGIPGDKVTHADYDGDGKTDISVYRPSTSAWYWINSSTLIPTGLFFGTAGDIPAPGDYDGDGRADQAIFRPSNGQWWFNCSTTPKPPTTFGLSGDTPTPNAFGN